MFVFVLVCTLCVISGFAIILKGREDWFVAARFEIM